MHKGGFAKNLRVINVILSIVILVIIFILIKEKKQNYSKLHERVNALERKVFNQ